MNSSLSDLNDNRYLLCACNFFRFSFFFFFFWLILKNDDTNNRHLSLVLLSWFRKLSFFLYISISLPKTKLIQKTGRKTTTDNNNDQTNESQTQLKNFAWSGKKKETEISKSKKKPKVDKNCSVSNWYVPGACVYVYEY